jgi:hypothetical protein
MKGALARVSRTAARVIAAERDFYAAVRDAHASGASVRTIEAAAREAVGMHRRGFTRERIRVIVREGGEQH